MDWSKAKTVIILALLAVNIFLLATYGFDFEDGNDVEDESALIEILADRGINIECDIPKTHEDMPMVNVKHKYLSDEEIHDAMESVKLDLNNEQTEASYKNAADKVIENLGIMGETLYVNSININGKSAEISYCNMINGIAIEPCYIVCKFNKGKMVDFEYKWLDVVNVSSELNIISAAVALMDFTTEAKDELPLTVNEINLVYYLDEDAGYENAVSDTAFASWEIRYNGDKYKHIVAYEQ